ncbi:hypothetical protein NKH97_32875 [Mesorhizobium sp. M0870]
MAATLLAQVESIFNSGVVYLSVWSALVPTGTTATIVTTYSESVFRDYMSVYTTTNWDGVVGTVASDNNSTGGLTTTVSIGALGAAIAIAGNATNGGIGTATWTGLTQQFSNTPVTNRNHSGAMAIATAAQAGLTVTCAYSTTPALAALLVVPLNMSCPGQGAQLLTGDGVGDMPYGLVLPELVIVDKPAKSALDRRSKLVIVEAVEAEIPHSGCHRHLYFFGN